MLKAYDALNPAYGPARADLFRYIVIYVNGGVYLDIKSGMEPNRTLDDTIGKMRRLVLAHWNWCLPVPFNHEHDVGETTWIQREQRYVQTRNRIFARKLPTCPNAKEIELVRGEYGNFLIAAPPLDATLRVVIDIVLKNIERQIALPHHKREKGKRGVIQITGPVAFARGVEKAYRDNGLKSPSEQAPTFHDLGVMYEWNAAGILHKGDGSLWWHWIMGHEDEGKDWHYSRQTTPVVLG